MEPDTASTGVPIPENRIQFPRPHRTIAGHKRFLSKLAKTPPAVIPLIAG
jgi:hypothetical protein